MLVASIRLTAVRIVAFKYLTNNCQNRPTVFFKMPNLNFIKVYNHDIIIKIIIIKIN